MSKVPPSSTNRNAYCVLSRKPAKTPLIAGVVCGAVLFIAWAIGFAVYFRKRYNRKKAKRLAEQGMGEAPKEKIHPDAETEYIIPPDPAVLLGLAKPGEICIPTKSREATPSSTKVHKHQRSHSKSRPSSPKAGKAQDDEMTEPLNPHSI